MKPEFITTRDGVSLGMAADISQLSEWRATAAQVRDAVLAGRIAGSAGIEQYLPPAAHAYIPTPREIDAIDEDFAAAITAGRLIDFAELPNDILKQGGNRGGPLYNQGALPMPFQDTWAFLHTWEQGVCVYLVKPLDDAAPSACEIAEFNPANVAGFRCLLLGDRALFEPTPDRPGEYRVLPAPSAWRFLTEIAVMNHGQTPEHAVAGNLIDPLMTALMILHTRGIERRTVAASAKLQRARMKARKPPIPSYDVIETKPYITALRADRPVGPRGAHQGGSHASPVPHIRMAHWRRLASGDRTFVRESLINFNAEAKAQFLASRSHYEVKR